MICKSRCKAAKWFLTLMFAIPFYLLSFSLTAMLNKCHRVLIRTMCFDAIIHPLWFGVMNNQKTSWKILYAGSWCNTITKWCCYSIINIDYYWLPTLPIPILHITNSSLLNRWIWGVINNVMSFFSIVLLILRFCPRFNI